jgi:hypothetical protein
MLSMQIRCVLTLSLPDELTCRAGLTAFLREAFRFHVQWPHKIIGTSGVKAKQLIFWTKA